MGAAIWAERARMELESLVVQRPHGGLTTAEPRVAALVAAGLSNEIAGKLFIAVHTVEVHLSHAYAKLGIRSRAQRPGWIGTADRPRVEVFRFAHGPRRVTVSRGERIHGQLRSVAAYVATGRSWPVGHRRGSDLGGRQTEGEAR